MPAITAFRLAQFGVPKTFVLWTALKEISEWLSVKDLHAQAINSLSRPSETGLAKVLQVFG